MRHAWEIPHMFDEPSKAIGVMSRSWKMQNISFGILVAMAHHFWQSGTPCPYGLSFGMCGGFCYIVCLACLRHFLEWCVLNFFWPKPMQCKKNMLNHVHIQMPTLNAQKMSKYNNVSKNAARTVKRLHHPQSLLARGKKIFGGGEARARITCKDISSPIYLLKFPKQSSRVKNSNPGTTPSTEVARRNQRKNGRLGNLIIVTAALKNSKGFLLRFGADRCICRFA